MSAILIISNKFDVHSDVVERYLIEESNESVIRINTDNFLSDGTEITFGFKEGIKVRGIFTPFSGIKSVWYRRPADIESNITDENQKIFGQRELKELLFNLYFNLNDALWVSKLLSLDNARRKYAQLCIARNIGMNIPKTCITNSPERVQKFYHQCDGKMVYKTLHLPIIDLKDERGIWGVPTSLVDSGLLDKIDLIKQSGGIFQEYVEKDYEIRVTVIGDNVFAAKLDSQKEPSAKIDWREAILSNKVPVFPYTLPPVLEKQCREVVKKFNLAFGAIDLIRKPNGDYIFLEINPNGQWLWVEDFTKQPLVRNMANLLSGNH